MSNNNCKRFVGKVAIVTASTEGIGFACAERLGLEGAKVVVSSRRQENVDRAVKQLKDQGIDVLGLPCHVGKPEDRKKLIDATIAKFGGIDILVSNAGMNPTFHPMLETTEQTWDKIFDVNLKSSFFLVKEVSPYIEKRGGGSIVLVSSVGGFRPNPFLGAYSVSKTAMLGLVKALCPELADKNIRINQIAPGVIKTKLSQALWTNDALMENIKMMTPLRRVGRPEECAGIVATLACDDASYITGETIVINGGEQSRL